MDGNVKIDQNKPILDFTIKVASNKFTVPCFADSGSSKCIFSLETARLLGLKLNEAKNECLIAANQQEINISGSNKTKQFGTGFTANFIMAHFK